VTRSAASERRRLAAFGHRLAATEAPKHRANAIELSDQRRDLCLRRHQREARRRRGRCRAGANDPYWLNFSLQVGGDWRGDPDNSTPFPSVMEVDYVRVYQD
jgi:hypothetical protein